jgi:hypothetical protein
VGLVVADTRSSGRNGGVREPDLHCHRQSFGACFTALPGSFVLLIDLDANLFLVSLIRTCVYGHVQPGTVYNYVSLMFAFGGLLPASCMLCDSRFCTCPKKHMLKYTFFQNQLEVHCRNIHSMCHPSSVLLADTVMLYRHTHETQHT